MSLMLATLSIVLFIAAEQARKPSQVFKGKGYAAAFSLGMIFLCLGLCGLVTLWWERILWGVLAVGIIASLWLDNHNDTSMNND